MAKKAKTRRVHDEDFKREAVQMQQFPVKPLPGGESVSSRFRVGLGKEKTGRLGD